MANLKEINQAICDYIETSAYPDASKNGLQVESSKQEIQKIAVSVDSGLSVIEQAVQENADALLVHHGLFWGEDTVITGSLAQKVETLLKNDCSLIAQHLPLDGNQEVGNNIELARLLNLKNVKGFWPLEDKFIGVQGSFSTATDLKTVVEIGKNLTGASEPFVLPFGPAKNKTCAVVSGSAAEAVSICQAEGIDLLVTGEPKQQMYHDFKEAKINAVCMGHYATETLGVRALAKWLENKFNVETFFINEPTGI